MALAHDASDAPSCLCVQSTSPGENCWPGTGTSISVGYGKWDVRFQNECCVSGFVMYFSTKGWMAGEKAGRAWGPRFVRFL